MGVISIVIGIINQLIIGGAPPCITNDKKSYPSIPSPEVGQRLCPKKYSCLLVQNWGVCLDLFGKD